GREHFLKLRRRLPGWVALDEGLHALAEHADDTAGDFPIDVRSSGPCLVKRLRVFVLRWYHVHGAARVVRGELARPGACRGLVDGHLRRETVLRIDPYGFFIEGTNRAPVA